MKRLKFIPYTLMLGLFLLVGSCTEEFEEINTDPNNPVTISPALLLPNAIQVSVDRYWGHSTRFERLNIDAAMCWIQHLARNIYINAEGDTYEIPITVSTGTWDNLYNSSLVNLEQVIELAGEGGAFQNRNYEGIALVMKAFTFSYLTDVFGPIPYSNALKGAADEPVNSPDYDSMEEIYAGVLEDLKMANEKLTIGGPAVNGDIMFDGDILRWKKFANSLRIKLANRQAAKKPAESRAIMQEILSSPETFPIFTGNDDYAQLNHANVIGSRNKMFDVFSTRSDWNISTTLVDKLLELDDDRISVYALPLADGSFAGLPNGLTDAAASSISASTIGQKFLDPEAPSILMTYSELMFILAEAALEGDIAGDHMDYLEMAISGSFEQHGLEMPADYISRLGNVDKEAIMTQKWIALFGQGIEAWTEYRRTGFPQMPTPDPNAIFVNDGVLPTRIEYPPSEYSLNMTNLEEGIQMLGGGDNMRTRLWWAE
ncbi:SusD/RagB family nutrient-binding outer membrane lipoprotein [Cyclobacterium plantarum]|uniref:SusD/RagB family nutrient-binding outer membrane lipoprotein n=1 Tax=Cyclobacterium plantarum TaxID=2716263 RepID=A0ABX0H4I0_9BACT|nr:SusD/RagB family nutrient-binding outer membrane lipoprotein [Cyclobacterium plantarum]NHE56736.1 SusD/RagB family nutrient-binding outer membrane lipoprotein [Cyclobacterium plantarum]